MILTIENVEYQVNTCSITALDENTLLLHVNTDGISSSATLNRVYNFQYVNKEKPYVLTGIIENKAITLIDEEY